jgi:outer membrane biosynthesis protein TonB
MPDYVSILRRSIAALPNPGPEMREAVYQRARAALARQLTAVDPPLSTREIEQQHQELEDAVAQLEADYVAEETAETELSEEEQREDDFFEPEPTVTTAAREHERRRNDALRGDEERAEEPADDEEDSEEDEFDEEERGSRAPMLIGLLLAALVVIGIGAYAYAERDALLGFVGMGGPEEVAGVEPGVIEPPAEPEPEPAEAEASDAPAKSADRLTNGAEPPTPAEPAEPEAPAEPPPAAAEAPPTPAETPPPAEQPAETATPEESPAAAEEQQVAALEQPSENLVGQRAIYYFQGSEGQPGQATEGSATWAEISKEGKPAIQAILRLEERDVTATVTIYRNEDASLPASHLVEVQFSGEIGSSAIQRVPALVLKQTEQARGQPLAGAAVPVTNDLFWIALSDDAEQVTQNLQLLREGDWFDIPILFQDGTRALLTFEKGIPGDRVFETVMATWTPG